MRRDLEALKNWRDVASRVLLLAKSFDRDACMHVFGSTVEGEITGSSDIDILLVVSDELDARKLQVKLLEQLEDMLGDKAYIIDLHVARRSQVNNPPYTWWIKKSITIC